MNELKTQAAKVLELLISPSTATTFRNAFSLAWQIVKEVGQLLWLVVCLGLVFVEWLWKTGYNSGRKTRDWVNTLDQPGNEQVFSETGKSLFEVGKASAAKAVASAKERLGIVEDPVESSSAESSSVTSISAPRAETKAPEVSKPAPTVVNTPPPVVNPLDTPKTTVE